MIGRRQETASGTKVQSKKHKGGIIHAPSWLQWLLFVLHLSLMNVFNLLFFPSSLFSCSPSIPLILLFLLLSHSSTSHTMFFSFFYSVDIFSTTTILLFSGWNPHCLCSLFLSSTTPALLLFPYLPSRLSNWLSLSYTFYFVSSPCASPPPLYYFYLLPLLLSVINRH